MTRGAFTRRMLNRYGQEMVVHSEGQKPITLCALIQQMGGHNKSNVEDIWTPAGSYDPSYSVYIGPAECRLDKMVRPVLDTGEERYRVIRSRAFVERRRVLYVWAVLKELPKEDWNDK